jgi:hypothetical protein
MASSSWGHTAAVNAKLALYISSRSRTTLLQLKMQIIPTAAGLTSYTSSYTMAAAAPAASA